MICPKCNSEFCYVIDSRKIKLGRKRRYKCEMCGERWNTVEIKEDEYHRLMTASVCAKRIV